MQTLTSKRFKGAVVGVLSGFDKTGRPLVEFDESDGAVAARTTTALDASQVGQEVVLLLERGNPRKPIVIGALRPPLERDVVLRCGKASVTLTRAGKVSIRGAYVLSRSSGVNRIQGGSVQIN